MADQLTADEHLDRARGFIDRAQDNLRPDESAAEGMASADLERALESLTALRQQIAEMERHRVEIGEELEFDRSAVADCLSAANRAIDGRHWLTEGRGPYEWNDDRWHGEFYAAAIEIKESLSPLTKIAANWKDCPQKDEEVAAARIDLKAQIAALTEKRDKYRKDALALLAQRQALTTERDQAREELRVLLEIDAIPCRTHSDQAWINRDAASRERIDELEAALRPFRDIAVYFCDKTQDTPCIDDKDRIEVKYPWAEFRANIRVRDMRMLAALSPTAQSTEPVIPEEPQC